MLELNGPISRPTSSWAEHCRSSTWCRPLTCSKARASLIQAFALTCLDGSTWAPKGSTANAAAHACYATAPSGISQKVARCVAEPSSRLARRCFWWRGACSCQTRGCPAGGQPRFGLLPHVRQAIIPMSRTDNGGVAMATGKRNKYE